jgi:NADH-ubiquinone oxidoreductase chain 2
MCLDYFKEESLNAFESIVLILLSTCNMLLIVSAYDLIAMYLTIEFQSLCFYVIVALKKDFEFSTKANF